MFTLERDLDTICALATPSGVAALAIIRLSGRESEAVIRKLAQQLPDRIESHRVYYTTIREPSSEHLIDEVIITYFAEGRSFTRESCFEISCHGSPAVVQQILRALIASGARMAEKGEFTYRAFVNGRIDLVQAESILSLIESQNVQSARLALQSLRGELSSELLTIESHLTWVMAQLEANIDFSSEDIEIASTNDISARIAKAHGQLFKLVKSYKVGRIVKDGVTVVIAGAPNVGKSSLFNRLADEDRSIVSSIAGTTRDTVDAEVSIDGLRLKLIDSAGIHDASNEIERMGIGRTLKAVKDADVILWVTDASSSEIQTTNIENGSAHVIRVGNKSDLGAILRGEDILVSAQTGYGIAELRAKMIAPFQDRLLESGAAISQARHFEKLSAALSLIETAQHLIEKDLSGELIVSELAQALKFLFDVRGIQVDDQVMDRVFSEFCLGK